MSKLITQLSEIPMDKSLLNHLQLDKIFIDFAKNFRKLDDLKNFRSDYEKRNALARWWDNDKLRDAQLDSAEVQAEFSKTLGQLVTISIVQAKELTEQQHQLNGQQQQISIQIEAIRKHSKSIEQQQEIQKAQASQLEKVVEDYIKVKGISDENIHRLARIVANIDQTKKELFAESQRIESYLLTEIENVGRHNQFTTNTLREDVELAKTEMQNSVFILKEFFDKNHKILVESLQNIYQKHQESDQNIKFLDAKIEKAAQDLTNNTEEKFTTFETLFNQINTQIRKVDAVTSSSSQHIIDLKSENTSILSKQAATTNEIDVIKVNLTKTIKQLKLAIYATALTATLGITAIGIQLLNL